MRDEAQAGTATHSPGRKLLLRTCWLPPALWVGAAVYIRQYDGWGAWAAAPLLLPAVILSIGLGVAGVVLLAMNYRRSRRWDGPLLGATALASGDRVSHC